MPATTTTSWPRRACSCASWSTWSAAPPTFSRAITCTIERLTRVAVVRDTVAASDGASAVMPIVSQKIAASGMPPNSAAPGEPAGERADPRRGQVCGRLVGIVARPRRARPARRSRTATKASDEEQQRADDPELVQHLVVRLLRDEARPRTGSSSPADRGSARGRRR